MAAIPNRGKRGSTRSWRRLRSQFHAQLPLPCALCPEMVTRDDNWHLHHAGKPFSDGGDGSTSWPAHKKCNLRQGNKTTAPVYYINPMIEEL